MTDRGNHTAVVLDPECAWAIARIAEATGLSHPTVLREMVRRTWSDFVDEELAARERGLAGRPRGKVSGVVVRLR